MRFPRYQPTLTYLLEKPLKITDSASFIQMYDEIFQSGIYDFYSPTQSPYIIDCGSNIGLSILYFKKKFPRATILGFEPDPTIYKTLKENLDRYSFNNVEIINKAVWITETTLTFFSEGGASGRIIENSENSNSIEVQATSLKNLITKKVDFLKIDIEGAEYEVLMDCKEQLHFIEKLFIEYHSHKDKKQKLGELLALLSNAGFRYHVKEVYTVPQPFIVRPPLLEMDLQLNIFAYRN